MISERVAELWGALRDVAVAHIAEVDVLAHAYLGDRAEIDQVTADELAARRRSGRVVVLDVRPASECAAGHIAGARSIPIDDLATAVTELPPGREVIAYCRGPYCVYADDAVRLLREQGFKARRLDVGYPEWQRAGLPTDHSSGGKTA